METRKRTNPIRADDTRMRQGKRAADQSLHETHFAGEMHRHSAYMKDVKEKSVQSLRTDKESGVGKRTAAFYATRKAGELVQKSSQQDAGADETGKALAKELEDQALLGASFIRDQDRSERAIRAWRFYNGKPEHTGGASRSTARTEFVSAGRRASDVRYDADPVTRVGEQSIAASKNRKAGIRGLIRTDSQSYKEAMMEERLKRGSSIGPSHEADIRSVIKRNRKRQYQKMLQRRRYQQMYRAARYGKTMSASTAIPLYPAGPFGFGGNTAWNISGGLRKVFRHVVTKNRTLWIGLLAVLILALLITTTLSSCSAILQGISTAVVATTYPSTDEDIYAVEEAYEKLETELDAQINAIKEAHPGYDSYYYQVDEIAHNPFHLISYLSVLYGGFTYDDVKDFLPELIQLQYTLNVNESQDNVITTKQVGVGESLGTVVTSGYCSCAICCGKYAGGPTASGVMPKAEHTLAVDANNPIVPLGTKIIMNGIEYTVEDTGAFGKYGVDFDVYYASHSEAQAHGHQSFEAFLADDNAQTTIEIKTSGVDDNIKVMLTNKGLDAVAKETLSKEQYQYFQVLNSTYGNRKELFDETLITISAGSLQDASGMVSAEAMSDERFARMITEANKYLGMPYVWGGSSPSTSFDCSGFISWVINHCGNGWNVGRQTAEGLRQLCVPIPASEAQPGDLIFFKGTYETSGASHVGLYVGNSRMIHCGKPIQYTNINSNYWQRHFYQFGRIP